MKRPPAPILEVSGLTVARGRAVILDGVAWTVRRGEHWVVLGPNGSGKTSLLKVLTGYLTPSEGEIAALGQRYGSTDWRDLRLKVGLVSSALQASIPPAEPALDTVVSGKYAQLDLWARPKAAERTAARKLLAWLGMAGIESREWMFLSQGERQRVLIARALMARPRLLILDEPCAGLDPVAREEFLRFVQALACRRDAPALVLVTHHVEEIVPAFNRALILRKGRVFAYGPMDRVLTAKNLGEAFGTRIRLARRAGRYRAEVAP